MSDVQTLLTRCYALGAEFFPQPDGKLKVRAPVPLPDDLRAALKQRKAEVLALLRQSPLWPCPACGGSVRLDPLDMTILPTRLWTCSSCGAYGTTREGAAFPAAWVSTRTVQ
jgi:ribosomal protein L37AE/L43A